MFELTSINWIVFFAVNAMILWSSACLAGRIGYGDDRPAPALITTVILYFAQITVTVLLIGVVVQHLNAYTLLALNAALSVLIVDRCRRQRPAIFRGMRESLALDRGWRETVVILVLALFAVELCLLLWKIVILPPHVWDVFCYHLTPAVEWFQQGRIPLTIDTPVERINSQTLGMTVLNYWYFVFLGNDMLVELPQFIWALLLVPVVYAYLRVAGLARSWAIKFAIAVFFIPIVVLQANTAKDHLGLNIGLLVAMFYMVEFLNTRDYRQLLLAAVTFGLMLGYKIAAPLYLAVSGAIFMVLLLANREAPFSLRQERTALIRTVSLSLVIMLTIGGYWYIRNLFFHQKLQGALHGSPVSKAAAQSLAGQLGLGHFVNNWHQFFARVFDIHGNYYAADLAQTSGFGLQFATLGWIGVIATIVVLWRRRIRFRAIHLWPYTALVLLLVYFFLYYSMNNYRLFSFFPMIMVAFAAVTFGRLELYRSRGAAMLVNGVVLAVISWSLLLTAVPQYTNPRLLREFTSLEAPLRTSADYTVWFVTRPSMYQLLKYLPASEPIAYISGRRANFPGEVGEDTWTYPYYDNQWRRRLTYLEQEQVLDCQKLPVCSPRQALRDVLREKKISLVSVCRSNNCLSIEGPDFFELVPGLYYYSKAVAGDE